MKAFELIAKPENWCKFYDAKNSMGHSVPFDDKSAVMFCIIGAIFKCYPEAKGLTDARTKICLNTSGPRMFNDTHTHAEVLAKLKELDL